MAVCIKIILSLRTLLINDCVHQNNAKAGDIPPFFQENKLIIGFVLEVKDVHH